MLFFFPQLHTLCYSINVLIHILIVGPQRIFRWGDDKFIFRGLIMEIYSLNFKLQDHVNHIRREPRSGMVTRRLWIMIKLKEREVGGERDCERERVGENGKDTTWERSWNYWGLEKLAFWLHRCSNKQPLNSLFRIKLWCRERKAFILGNANVIYRGYYLMR